MIQFKERYKNELDHEIDLDSKITNTSQNNSINYIKNKEESDNKLVNISEIYNKSIQYRIGDINKTSIKEPENEYIKEYNIESFNESDELFKELENHSVSIRRKNEITKANLEQINKKLKKLELYISDSSCPLEKDYYIKKYNKLVKLYNRIRHCGYYLIFKEYLHSDENIKKVKLKRANFCGNQHFCLNCATRRRAKIIRIFDEKCKIVITAYPKHKLGLLTLTIKNGDNLEERLNHLKESLSKLRDHGRRTRKKQRGYNSEFGKVIGSITSIEITKDNGYGEKKDTGWHIHAHLLILHEADFNYASFQDEWLKITGDSHVLNLTPINNTDQDIINTLSYMLKPSELTAKQNFDLFDVTVGRRFLESGGAFRGVIIPESNIKLEPEDLPYLELLYLYDEGRTFHELHEINHKEAGE